MSTHKAVLIAFIWFGYVGSVPSVTTAFAPVTGVKRHAAYDLARNERTIMSPLFGKAKRGRLVSNIDVKDTTSAKQVREELKTRNKEKKSKSGSKEEQISPLLAEWAATSDESAEKASKPSSVSVPPFESFDELEKPSNKKKRNNKQPSVRQMALAELDENVEQCVSDLKEVLESESKQKDINDILNPIRQLVTLSSATDQFRALNVGAKRNDYCLAWVGSDDAVCHVGTGLHKVPLARLQEVFLSLPGRNTIELTEVIRILGPFPNVKNVLQGNSAIGKSSSSNGDSIEWSITWDSMLDGTGKERLAGTEDNIRRVSMHVYAASEQVLVAVVPPNDQDPSKRREDIFEDMGKHLLVFVKEDDLELKLEKYRVA